MHTKDAIISNSVSLLASKGYAGTSMRDIAAAAGILPSVIYHYFPDKKALFWAVREQINHTLSEDMRRLSGSTAGVLLRQQLRYQFEQRLLITALLQYFMAMRPDFPHGPTGYVPERAYVHNIVVIEQGVTEGAYYSVDPMSDAKMMGHLVNGFLLEYAGQQLSASERNKLIDSIATYIERSLRPSSVTSKA
jgi:AcrR family transcriptional regulator